MNRTSIEWCDFTWNPVTGCLGPRGTPEKPNRCSYCYAHRLANGRLKPLYLSNSNVAPGCDPDDPFSPRFWPERLEEPSAVKKPSRIFVCSMGDLFFAKSAGLNKPWWAALKIIARTMRSPVQGRHHTYMMLTKNPQNIPSYPGLPWNENEWLGITVTNQADWDERWPLLAEVEAAVKFVSFEPLLGPVEMTLPERLPWSLPDWIILGAQTGVNARQPKHWWVHSLRHQAMSGCIPFFLKDNLDCEAMGIDGGRNGRRRGDD